MSKPPNTETQLRNLRREMKELREKLYDETLRANRAIYQQKVLTSERDEWKRRFDDLLTRLPVSPSSSAERPQDTK